MINNIQGSIAHIEPTCVVIETNGGVGYEIKISLNTYTTIKEKKQCKLLTYLHISDSAHTLFGFDNIEEKTIFIKLISVSGVGPNTGLIVTSFLATQEIEYAIAQGQVEVLEKVKGIGKKTAQRIILELKDKIKKTQIEPQKFNARNMENETYKEALSALLTLGMKKNIAEKNLNNILKQTNNIITLEELIKLALKES